MKKLIFFSVTAALMFILGACEKNAAVLEQEDLVTVVVNLTAPTVSENIAHKADKISANDVRSISLFLVCENTPEKVFEFKNAKLGRNTLVLTREQTKIALAAEKPAISVNFYGDKEWLSETGAENVTLTLGTNTFTF